MGSNVLLTPVAECLVLEASDGSIHPFLAKSWDININDLQITFQLRDDVSFSDGSKFNAESVAWNINYMIETKQLNPAIHDSGWSEWGLGTQWLPWDVWIG